MCIAILTMPGKVVRKDVFERCWHNNNGGAGFAYVDPVSKEVSISKGYMELEAAKMQYFRLAERYGEKYPMLVHFRLPTVGDKNASNCHPFKVKGGAMIHNGTFWRDAAAKKSDTAMLAEMMHNELTYENLAANKEQFQEAFGYNRVVFLFKEGRHHIVSEHYNNLRGQYGQWDDGIWYSNGGWYGSYGGYYGEDKSVAEAAANRDNWFRHLQYD